MHAYVLDTSVAVAWYVQEAFAERARFWQSRMLRDEVEFYVPTLHFWELGNVLRTYVRRGELEPELAQEIYDLHLDAPLVVVDPDRAGILSVALEYRATTYDAVYIALSTTLQAVLLTAEKTTTPWVVKMGDRVQTLQSDKL